MNQGRHRVVIVGGGFGGIRATLALARTDVDITIVDRTNHHLFQPLLYQVATGILPDGLIAPALRSVVSKQANAHVVLADCSTWTWTAGSCMPWPRTAGS
jgi:NADH dehydrogenase